MPPVVSLALLADDDPRNPWFSWQYVRKNLDSLTSALSQHVWLTVASVAVAAVIGIPLAIVSYRVSALAGPVLAVSGVFYTIPSLALFALLGPILGLSFSTVLIGLVLYALLIIVRNALTGLRQVPAEVREAAQGMGYGPAALLWRIELPLALPGILTGFNSNFYKPMIMTGTLGCLGLALLFDLVLIGLGRLVMPWARRGARTA